MLVGHLNGGPRVDLSMVLPTYNEAESIAAVVEQLGAALDSVPGLNYELIIVDDDSPDRTWEQAQRLQETMPRIRAVRRQGERGLATAVVRGWQVSRGSVLGVIDADLQHPPEVTKLLWAAMAQGADLAVASRHVAGGGVSDWRLHRRMISRSAQAIGLVLLPDVLGKVKDPMSGYFMVQRSALEQRELCPVGYKILLELLARAPMHTIAEVPYTFRERADGASKVTGKVYWDYVRHMVRLRLHRSKQWLGLP